MTESAGNDHLANLVEFINNPESRVPCVVLLDISSSMGFKVVDPPPIVQVNDGIKRFKEELLKDELTARRADVAIITFNSRHEVVQNFGELADFNPPELEASGGTLFGPAITTALGLVEERKEQYKQNGISYYRPIVMLVTDGKREHYEDPDELAQIAERIKEAEDGKHLTFFAVGTETADMDFLSTLSNGAPKMLVGYKFGELFQWLSGSITAISYSGVSEKTQLPSTSKWSIY